MHFTHTCYTLFYIMQILLAVSQCFEVLELLEMGISYHPLNADFHVIKGSCLLKLLVIIG